MHCAARAQPLTASCPPSQLLDRAASKPLPPPHDGVPPLNFAPIYLARGTSRTRVPVTTVPVTTAEVVKVASSMAMLPPSHHATMQRCVVLK